MYSVSTSYVIEAGFCALNEELPQDKIDKALAFRS